MFQRLVFLRGFAASGSSDFQGNRNSVHFNLISSRSASISSRGASMPRPYRRPLRLHPFCQSIHAPAATTSTPTPSVSAEHPCPSHHSTHPDVSAEHPCPNYDNVHPLHPFPQSIHVPTMMTSTQTPSVSSEHPCPTMITTTPTS